MRCFEPGIPEASGRVHNHPVGTRTRVKSSGACIFKTTNHLFPMRFEYAERVGELLGVRVRGRGLGAKNHRDSRDLSVFGQLPQAAQQTHVLTRPGRSFQSNADSNLAAGNAWTVVRGDGGRCVLAYGRIATKRATKESAPARGESVEINFGARSCKHAAARVVAQVVHLNVTTDATNAWHVEPENRPRAKLIKHIIVLAFEIDLDRAGAQ